MKRHPTDIPAQIFTIIFHGIKGSILGLLILCEIIGNLVITLFSLINPLRFFKKKSKKNAVKIPHSLSWFEEYFPQYNTPWKKLYLLSLTSLIILIPAFFIVQKRIGRVSAESMSLSTSAGQITITVNNKYEVIMNTGDTTDYLSIYDKDENNASPDKVSELIGPTIKTGGAGGSITHQSTQTGTSVSSTSISVTSNGSGTDQLYIAAVAIYASSGTPVSVSSISGGSLTWTHQKTQCSGRLENPSVEIWQAFGSPGTSFTATVTLSDTPARASAAVSRYSNADTTTPTTAAAGSNTNGLNGACSGGSDSTSLSLTLTSSTDGSVHYVATHPRHRTLDTEDAQYTQRAAISNVSGGDGANLYVHDKTMSTAGSDSADHTVASSVDWDMAGLVINPVSSGETYSLRYDNSRTTDILEYSDTRIRIRVSGCLDTDAGSACLDDGSTDLAVTEEYTFTPEGFFVENVTDFQTSGVALPSSNADDGYRWLELETDITNASFDDTASIYYGNGTTESSTSTDGVAFEDSNTYVVLPGHGTGSYQSHIIGVTDWLSQTGGTDDWYWNEDTNGEVDSLYAREQGTTPTGEKTMRWFMQLHPKATLDTEIERETYHNDYANPDTLSITTGSTWQELGADDWNESEGTYALSMSGNQATFDIDGNTYNRNNSIYKLRGYRGTSEPDTLTLEGVTQTNGTDYNAAVKPFSDADFYDSSGTSYTQLAAAGNTSDASEYLYDDTNDFTIAFDTSDYLYLGLDSTFTGVTTALSTAGSGNSPTLTWEYCSANSDTASACDTWSTLSTTNSIPGADNLTVSGSFYFSEPGTWLEATVNSGPSLFYIRASLTSGSYSTSPIEDLIVPDILVFQHEAGSITSASQTWGITSAALDTTANTAASAIWIMDENQGTTAHDTQGNNNLTLAGATWENSHTPTARAIHLHFDGSDDYLLAPTSTDFNFGTGSFSITGWFRHPESISGTDVLLARYEDSGYKIYMNSSGNLCFGIDDDSTWGPDDSTCSTADYSDNNWHHFVAVKSSTSSITLYVDNQQVGQDASLAATGSLNDDAPLFIGIDTDGSSNPWDGYTDQIILYAAEKSADEVLVENLDQSTALFGQGLADNLTDGLVGWWQMNDSGIDAEGETVSDSSGNGNNLTLYGDDGSGDNGSGLDCTLAGKFGSGCDFDGVDDFLSVSDPADGSLDFGTNDFSVSYWANYSTIGANGFRFVSKRPGATGAGWSVGSTGSGVAFRMDDGSTAAEAGFGSTNYTGSWHHFVFVFDRDSGLYGYVDGELIGSYDITGINGSVSNTSPFNINAFADASSVAEGDGTIDDVKVYNRTLSANEARQLYNWAPAPVAYWDFDENTGTSTVADSSGNGYSGTMNGSMTAADWVTGKYGSALEFDGGNDYIDTSATATELGFDDATKPFTISLWAKTSGSGEYYLFDNWDGSPAVDVSLRLDNGAVETYISDATFSNGTPQYGSGYNDGAWHHISLTWDGAGKETISVDGVEIGSTTSASITGNLDTGSNFWIGQRPSPGSYYPGQIDEVRVYNYARTTQQVVEDMNGSHPTGGSPVGSQVGRWKFDEMFGDTAYDAVKTNNLDLGGSGQSCPASGSTTCPTWTKNGKIGAALTFDGIDDYVYSATEDDYEVASKTITFWANPTDDASSTEGVVSLESGNWYVGFADFGRMIASHINTTPTQEVSYSNTSLVTAGEWHHYAYTFDVTGSDVTVSFYIDGRNVGTSTYTTGYYSSYGTHVVIGSFATSSVGPYHGMLDEVKIYTSVLTPAQIAIDMNAGASSNFGTGENEADKLNDGAGDAPVGYWPMDENTGTSTTYDKSGNGNDGTLTSLTESAWSPGKHGSALSLDGTADYIDIGTGPTSVKTVTFWTYPETTTEYFINLASTTDYISASGGTLSATGLTSPTIYVNGIESTTIAANTWSHVAVVTDTAENASNFDIGRTTNSNYLEGKIDEVKLFDYALTQGQIAYEYNRGGPVGWWRLDECSGSTVYDASGHGNNGTITVGATGSNTSTGTCSSGTGTEAWNNGTTGKYNGSLDFDGTDDAIQISDDTALRGDQFSLSAWVKPQSSGIYATLVTKEPIPAGSGSGYGFRQRINDKFRAVLGKEGDGDYVESNTTLSAGNWYHLTSTFDGSTMKLYVNGVLESSVASSRTVDSTTDVFIGRLASDNEYFDGQIDDVRIYNYALSADQVKSVMNTGAARFE